MAKTICVHVVQVPARRSDVYVWDIHLRRHQTPQFAEFREQLARATTKKRGSISFNENFYVVVNPIYHLPHDLHICVHMR